MRGQFFHYTFSLLEMYVRLARYRRLSLAMSLRASTFLFSRPVCSDNWVRFWKEAVRAGEKGSRSRSGQCELTSYLSVGGCSGEVEPVGGQNGTCHQSECGLRGRDVESVLEAGGKGEREGRDGTDPP